MGNFDTISGRRRFRLPFRARRPAPANDNASAAGAIAGARAAARARRFVWGRYDLFAKLAEALPAPASALGVDAAGGPV